MIYVPLFAYLVLTGVTQAGPEPATASRAQHINLAGAADGACPGA